MKNMCEEKFIDFCVSGAVFVKKIVDKFMYCTSGCTWHEGPPVRVPPGSAGTDFRRGAHALFPLPKWLPNWSV